MRRTTLVLFTCLASCSASSESAGVPSSAPPPADTGSADASSPDVVADGGENGPDVVTPPPPPAPKPTVFVAIGHMGRTVMSCDGGLTWIHDRSDDDAARCWTDGPNYVECDHTALSARNGGLTYGDGWFYASYGWGFDGSVRRSKDGAQWETVKTGGWGGGVASAKHSVFVAWEGSWSTSSDDGTTWQPLATSPRANFDHAYPVAVGDEIIVMGRAGAAQESAISADGGLTWTEPSGLGADDGSSFAAGNGVFVSVGSNGTSARSVDAGSTWTSQQVIPTGTGNWATNIVFDGANFVAWGAGMKWSSPDGVTWSKAAFTIDGAAPAAWWHGPVSFNPGTKTYAAVLDVWGNYYEKQLAYHSADGVAWTALDAAHFKGGHPIRTIVAGEVDPSACQ
jgi:hypothetical protein